MPEMSKCQINLVLEDVDLVQEQDNRSSEEPSGVDNGFKEGE
jgi:hypothetical protein